MRLRLPSKTACEKFNLTYELKGCQEASNYLCRYYGTRRLKFVFNGRKVMRMRTHKKYAAHYCKNRAYFVKRFIDKRTVLHETFHHLIYAKGIDLPLRKEEIMAEEFAKFVMKHRF